MLLEPMFWYVIFHFQIYGWLPEPYNHTKLPSDMPESLTRYINSSESGLSPKEKDEMIWFSCEGENPADAEHIGQVDYYPRPGVPSYFYPYKNQDGYLSPVVFAHFSNPKRENNQLLFTYIFCLPLFARRSEKAY